MSKQSARQPARHLAPLQYAFAAAAVALFLAAGPANRSASAQASQEYKPVDTSYHPVQQNYQPVRQEYSPAKANVNVGGAPQGAPSAGSLTAGAPSAGSLTMGKPTAGSLGGSIGAGSIAPPVGVPVNTMAVPMSSLAASPEATMSLAERHRMMKSTDSATTGTRSSRSARQSRSRRSR